MAMQPSAEDGTAPKATKRLRWATQKVKGKSAGRKRISIMDRFHKSTHGEKKRDSAGAESMATDPEGLQGATEGSEDGSETSGDHGEARNIYFNIPLPPEALDENGHPAVRFNRNKIRTSKYTPLSFIPKNLWFQFQNIANDYFLFLIILNVSNSLPRLLLFKDCTADAADRSSASLAP
jgi:phospholipid-translocating ATPase